jgi:hypothetical protein
MVVNNGGEFQHSSAMNSLSGARKLRCGTWQGGGQDRGRVACLSFAPVSLNSRINRHPPSERPNSVEATSMYQQ